MLYGFLDFRAQICSLKCCCVDCLEKRASCHKCCCTVFLNFRAEKQQSCCTDFCLEICANVQPLAVRPPFKNVPAKQLLCSSIFVPTCCTAFLETEPKLLYGFSRKSCPKSAFHCVLTLLYGLAETLLWNVCQSATSLSSLPRNLPCSLALLLPICS